MRRVLFTAALAATLLGRAPQALQGQILSGVVGAVAGTAGGGYITLSIVVARAQFGHYLHDYHDLFDITSLPILIGAGTGVTLGVWQPPRLWSSLIYGTGGTALGFGVGYVIGQSVSDRPEAKWAAAAIGSGAGMALGTIIGIMWPRDDLLPREVTSASVVPIGFRLRF